MLAEKRKVSTQQTTDYIWTKLSFSLLRSTLLCLRGAHSLKIEHNLNDICLSNSVSRKGWVEHSRIIIYYFPVYVLLFHLFIIGNLCLYITLIMYKYLYGVQGLPPCYKKKIRKTDSLSITGSFQRVMSRFKRLAIQNRHWYDDRIILTRV